MSDNRRDFIRTVFYVGGVEFGLAVGGLVGIMLIATDKTPAQVSPRALSNLLFMASSLLVGYLSGCIFGLIMYAFKEKVLTRYSRKT